MPQYQLKDMYFSCSITSSLCEQPFEGLACQYGHFLGAKTPPAKGGSWAQPLRVNTEAERLIRATGRDGLFKL